MIKLKTFDSGYSTHKSHFKKDRIQNYLVFQPIIRYFKVNTIINTDYILSWNSKGLYSESIKPPTTSDNILTPGLNCYGTKTRKKNNGSCSQQSKISYIHSTISNIYIIYELGICGSHNNDPRSKKIFIWYSYFN